MKIINASIDLSKIDKSKIIQGKKGKYLNIDIGVFDEKNEYGQDVSITIHQTKEEREAGKKKVYLGNGKTVYSSAEYKKEGESTEDWNGGGYKESQGSEVDDLPF